MSKVLKRAIVTPDKHFPLQYQPAINCVKQVIEIVKPNIYIDLGDTGEWGNFSHWKWKRKKKPPLEVIIPTLDQDVKDVNARWSPRHGWHLRRNEEPSNVWQDDYK